MARQANVFLKLVLVALIAAAVAFGESERFSDKAMEARVIAYPLSCALPAAGWWVSRRLDARRVSRRSMHPYPHRADALVTSAFVVDLGGNALDLFDRLSWFDDAAHFTNWLLLGLALGVTLSIARRWWEVIWLVAGAGAIAAIIWEAAEYSSFVLNVEQVSIYRDTLGDLILGTTGALVAGLIVAVTNRGAGQRGSEPANPGPAG